MRLASAASLAMPPGGRAGSAGAADQPAPPRAAKMPGVRLASAASLAMPPGGRAGSAGAAGRTRTATRCENARRAAGVRGVACDAAWRPCRLRRRGRTNPHRHALRKCPACGWRPRRRLRCRLEAVPAPPARPDQPAPPRAAKMPGVRLASAASLAMPPGGRAGSAGAAGPTRTATRCENARRAAGVDDRGPGGRLLGGVAGAGPCV